MDPKVVELVDGLISLLPLIRFTLGVFIGTCFIFAFTTGFRNTRR